MEGGPVEIGEMQCEQIRLVLNPEGHRAATILHPKILPMPKYQIVDVDPSNIHQHGVFCIFSPKHPGYRRKIDWLRKRFKEGLRFKLPYLKDADEPTAFIEYIPGEHTWRVVDAPDHLVIHCLWVVGRAKEKGYGSRLLSECIADARNQGKRGVAMVSSRGNWLAHEGVFLRNGFERIDSAPPGFSLLLNQFEDGAKPSFPQDWEARLESFGSGTSVVYSDQCPYMPNVVSRAVELFAERGIEAKAVRLDDAEAVRAESPSAYGVFGIVCDGRLLTYHCLGKKELRLLDEEILA